MQHTGVQIDGGLSMPITPVAQQLWGRVGPFRCQWLSLSSQHPPGPLPTATYLAVQPIILS